MDNTHDFPTYPEADVHFVIAPGQTYELYSRTLKIHSSRLQQMLNPDDAAKLTSEARRKGVSTLYHVELMSPEKCRSKGLREGSEGVWTEGAGGLTMRRLDNRGRPVKRGTIDASAFDAGHLTNTLHAHWDNVLRAMHQQPMEFSYSDSSTTNNPTTLSTLVDSISGIISVATYLNCMPCVTHQIDNALIKQGAILWVAIAAAPWRWADLALKVRSELVFREAVTHLVGRWPRLLHQASRHPGSYFAGTGALDADLEYAAKYGFEDPRDAAMLVDDDNDRAELAVSPQQAKKAHTILSDLHPSIRHLVTAKLTALSQLKRATNMRIMGYYPTFFSRAGAGHSMAPRTQTVGEAIAALGAQLQNSMGAPLPGLVLGAHTGADARMASHALGAGPSSVGPGSHTIRHTGASTRAAAYHKDILGWMAVTLFRHWFGQYVLRLTSGVPQLDGGFAIYQSLARGGESYLGHSGVEGFCGWFPLSAKSRRDFEAVLSRIKDELKGYVGDVVRSRLSMDVEKAGSVVERAEGGVEGVFGRESGVRVKNGRLVLGYLVCTEVGSGELPWVVERRAAAAVGRGGTDGTPGRGAMGMSMAPEASMQEPEPTPAHRKKRLSMAPEAEMREGIEGIAGIEHQDGPTPAHRKKRLRFDSPSARYATEDAEQDDAMPPPRKRRDAFGSKDADEAPAARPISALSISDAGSDEDEEDVLALEDLSENGMQRGGGPFDDDEEDEEEDEENEEEPVTRGNPLFLTPRRPNFERD